MAAKNKVTEAVKDAASSVAHAAQEHVIQPAGEAIGLAGEQSAGRNTVTRKEKSDYLGFSFCNSGNESASKRSQERQELGRSQASSAACSTWPVRARPPVDPEGHPAVVDYELSRAYVWELLRNRAVLGLVQPRARTGRDRRGAAAAFGGEPMPSPSIASFALTPESFESAIGNVILLGGDTDTLAAMAGALSGAYLSAGRLPGRQVGLLESSPKGRDYFRQLAGQLLTVYHRGAEVTAA